MYAVLGRVVFWTAVTLGAEYALKKTGVGKAIIDGVSNLGKAGSRQVSSESKTREAETIDPTDE